MKIGRENRSTRIKPALAPLYPPQIPHNLTRARTRAAVVGSRRLTAWAMARSDSTVKCTTISGLIAWVTWPFEWGFWWKNRMFLRSNRVNPQHLLQAALKWMCFLQILANSCFGMLKTQHEIKDGVTPRNHSYDLNFWQAMQKQMTQTHAIPWTDWGGYHKPPKRWNDKQQRFVLF
jgi:hypothetical protein